MIGFCYRKEMEVNDVRGPPLLRLSRLLGGVIQTPQRNKAQEFRRCILPVAEKMMGFGTNRF